LTKKQLRDLEVKVSLSDVDDLFGVESTSVGGDFLSPNVEEDDIFFSNMGIDVKEEEKTLPFVPVDKSEYLEKMDLIAKAREKSRASFELLGEDIFTESDSKRDKRLKNEARRLRRNNGDVVVDIVNPIASKEDVRSSSYSKKQRLSAKRTKKENDERFRERMRRQHQIAKKDIREPKGEDLSFEQAFRKMQVKNKQHERKLLKSAIKLVVPEILEEKSLVVEQTTPKKFTKEESALFREEAQRRKSAKRAEKKKRQSLRRNVGESGSVKHEEYVFGQRQQNFSRGNLASSGVGTSKRALYWDEDDYDVSEVSFFDSVRETFSYIEEYQRELRVISVFIYQMWRSRSLADYAAAVHQLIEILGLPSLPVMETLVKSFVSRNFEKLEAWLHPKVAQNGPTVLGKIADMFDLVLASTLVDSLKKLVLTLFSFKLFDKDIGKSISSHLGTCVKMTTIELIPFLLKCVDGLFRVGRAIISGVPVCEAIFCEDPMAVACSRVSDLIAFRELTYTGLPVEGRIDLKLFLTELKANLDLLSTGVKSLSSTAKSTMYYNKILGEGRIIFANKLSEFGAGSRPAPIGIVVHGLPGTGKGKVLPHIASIMSNVRGRDFSTTHIYSRSLTSDYWEGYSPASHPYIHYSEVGRVHPALARSQGDKHVNELISLIDTLPFVCDMAFSDKGKIFARPELVLIDTNNVDMNLEFLVNNKAAYKRRFIFVEVIVKPEFCITGSSSIDPEKVIASGAGMDAYIFNITKYNATSNTGTIPDKKLVRGNIYQLDDVLTQLFSDHILLQQRIDGSLGLDGDNFEYQNVAHASVSDDVNEDIDNEDDGDDDIDIIPPPPPRESVPRVEISRSASGLGHANSLAPLEGFCNEEKDWAYTTEIVAQSGLIFSSQHTVLLTIASLWDRARNYCRFIRLSMSIIAMFVTMLGWDTAIRGYVVKNITPIRQWTMAAILVLVTYCYSWIWPWVVAILLIQKLLVYTSEPQQAARLDDSILLWKHYVFGTHYNPFEKFSMLSTRRKAMMITIPAAAVLIYKYRTTLFSWMMSSESDNIEAEVGLEDYGILNLEEQLGAGSEMKRVPVNNTQIWNVIKPLNPPVYTGDLETFSSKAIKNTRFVVVIRDGGWKSYILGVRGSLALINLHVFKDAREVRVRISRTNGIHVYKKDKNGKDVNDIEDLNSVQQTGWFEIDLSMDNVTRVTDDIGLFDTLGICYTDIVSHFPMEQIVGSMRAMVYANKYRATFSPGELHFSSDGKPISAKGYLTYGDVKHQSGMCGLPVVVEYQKGAVIGGLHMAGYIGRQVAYAKTITRQELTRAFDLHASKSLCVNLSQGALLNVSIEEPSRKSVFRYEVLHDLEYHGKIEGPVIMESSSKVVATPYNIEAQTMVCEILKQDVPNNFGPPLMRPCTRKGVYVSPYNLAMKSIASPKKTLNQTVLKRIQKDLISRFTTLLRSKGVVHLKPLSVSQAINGVDGDCFIKSMNFSTSAGFGLRGLKSDYLPLNDQGLRYPGTQVVEGIAQTFSNYARGLANRDVFVAHLKDEPRTLDKIAQGKTRVFYGAALVNNIVARMLLAPFYSLLVQYHDVFRSMVGINMVKGADSLVREIYDFCGKQHGDDTLDILILEGDYKNYDQCMPMGVGECVNGIILEVLRFLGYNDVALRATQGILTDNLFPYVEMLKDLFCAPGLQPSGKYGTAEDNSLRGLVLLMYAWYIHPDLKDEDFFVMVLPFFYGDDVTAAVLDERFNNLYYQRVVRTEMGMDFTSSTKKDTMDKFVVFSEMSFLKRTFVYDSFLQRYVSPLDAKSIVRALSWTQPSGFVSAEQQSISVFQSMAREMYLHGGRTVYIQFIEKSSDILQKYFLISHEEIQQRKLFPSCVELEESMFGQQDSPTTHTSDPYLDISFLTEDEQSVCSQSGSMSTQNGRSQRHENIVNLIMKHEKERDALLSVIANSEWSHLMNMSGTHLRFVCIAQNVPDDMLAKLQRAQDLKITLDRLTNIYDMRQNMIRYQSGPISLGVGGGASSTHETFEDKMGEEEEVVSAIISKGPDINQETKLTLDNFFARPVEIDAFTVVPGSPIHKTYRLWDLWSLNPTVRSKFRNMSYFKGNLHVRISVSGTPFHFGRLMLSYQPYAAYNEPLLALNTSTLSFSDMTPLLLNYLSQTELSTVIDIKENKPVEMTCPFISPKPMHRLFNDAGTAISAATSFDDFRNAGNLYLISINDVGSVSTTPTNIFVQIYCWATDVELGTATGTWMQITTESGPMDEREVGVVQRWSSSAKDISAALSSVPVIAPLATASTIFFGALERVAAIFGWSRPVLVDEPMIVKNNPFQNGAQTIGCETSMRITLDPKQELSVDPRVVSLSRDDMVISDIAKRTTYLTTFSWNPTDVQMVPIWSSRITPCLCTLAIGGDGQAYMQPTAAYFASMPFCYWRGDIIFTFEIVCSAFHRGKLGILTDPNISAYDLITSDLGTNKQFMTVVDLQDSQRVEVRVNWQQYRAWATIDNNFHIDNYNTDMRIDQPEYTNGFIVLFPFTRLQSPLSDSIPINIYVHFEDLQVNYLADRNLPTSRRIRAESGRLSDDIHDTIMLNDSAPPSDDICMYHFGERPVSFRSLLKRYAQSSIIVVSSNTDPTTLVTHLKLPIMPLNGVPMGSSSSNVPYNLFTYLRLAFLGYRGGIRKRIILGGDPKMLNNSMVQVTLSIPRTTDVITNEQVEYSGSSLNGTVHFCPASNGGIEVELPFYSGNLFQFSFNDLGYPDGGPSNEMESYWLKAYHIYIDSGVVNSFYTVVEETATGEDFSFLRYQGAPYFSYTL